MKKRYKLLLAFFISVKEEDDEDKDEEEDKEEKEKEEKKTKKEIEKDKEENRREEVEWEAGKKIEDLEERKAAILTSAIHVRMMRHSFVLCCLASSEIKQQKMVSLDRHKKYWLINSWRWAFSAK